MGDRSFIMIVGLQYGIFCCVLSAFCLNHTVSFVVGFILEKYEMNIDLDNWFDGNTRE